MMLTKWLNKMKMKISSENEIYWSKLRTCSTGLSCITCSVSQSFTYSEHPSQIITRWTTVCKSHLCRHVLLLSFMGVTTFPSTHCSEEILFLRTSRTSYSKVSTCSSSQPKSGNLTQVVTLLQLFLTPQEITRLTLHVTFSPLHQQTPTSPQAERPPINSKLTLTPSPPKVANFDRQLSTAHHYTSRYPNQIFEVPFFPSPT